MRTEGQQGDSLMLKAAALGLQVDIQVFKFNTITDSICMYHFPREKPSEDRASQISIPREPDAKMVEDWTFFEVHLSMIVLPAAQVLHQSSAGTVSRAAEKASAASTLSDSVFPFPRD